MTTKDEILEIIVDVQELNFTLDGQLTGYISRETGARIPLTGGLKKGLQKGLKWIRRPGCHCREGT